MAIQLRERFGPKEPPGAMLAEDFSFLPIEHGPLREFRIEKESLGMLETPLAVSRRYVLSRGLEGMQIELTLCLESSLAAIALLFERASSFQRIPPDDAFQDTAIGHAVGNAGLMWRWDKEQDGVLGFVRYNVLIFMQGRYDVLLEAARSLDHAIARLRTTTTYGDSEQPIISVNTAAVKRGGRFDLEVAPDRNTRSFFLANGGAVNLDPANPVKHYYRAGLEPGRYRITVYRVGTGLLPSRQTLPVTIT